MDGSRCCVAAPASGELEIGGRGFAALHHHLIADLLTFVEATQASRLHRGDMDEHVLAAVLRHDEAETLCGVEPLDCTDSHCLRLSPSDAPRNGARCG